MRICCVLLLWMCRPQAGAEDALYQSAAAPQFAGGSNR